MFPGYIFAALDLDGISETRRNRHIIQVCLNQNYPEEKIVFFGDKTFPGGNDYELACALRQLPNTQIIQVNHPQEVFDYLEKEHG